MKTKNIKYLYIAVVILFTTVSCTENFLEVTPKGTDLEETYYKNADEAYSALVAAYDIMSFNSSSWDNMISFMNAGSDDNYGASVPGDAISLFSYNLLTPTNMPQGFWSNHYQGIFRANTLLEKLPNVPMDENLKLRFAAECKAMRAYYHFNLVRLFGNIPLMSHTISPVEALTYPQSKPEDVYAQIEQDLLDAITDLPTSVDVATEGGRWTKGAAQAMLGKVYLYDNKNAEAAAQLAEVNGTPGQTSQYGYRLLDNFKDLWVHSNKFNSESILEDVHSDTGRAGWGDLGFGTEGNILNIMVGIRDYTRTDGSTAPDYFPGWGVNTVTQNLYDVMNDDPRFDATIIDVKALIADGQVVGYSSVNEASTNTGYFMAKFVPLKSDASTLGGDQTLNFYQDTYIIRLADTYLLEAEALGGTGARAQALLDAVRARVGLPSTPVSLDAIALERRKELACEGHRFFDLVRTGKAASVLASRGFIAGKNEILPIPVKELENSIIVQNPGY
jgi:starch-binding outer membrane protein, SusD/RagB family